MVTRGCAFLRATDGRRRRAPFPASGNADGAGLLLPRLRKPGAGGDVQETIYYYYPGDILLTFFLKIFSIAGVKSFCSRHDAMTPRQFGHSA
jgi:hypothetical protein